MDAYGDPVPPGHGDPEPAQPSSHVYDDAAWEELAEIERFLADFPPRYDLRVLDSLAEDLAFTG